MVVQYGTTDVYICKDIYRPYDIPQNLQVVMETHCAPLQPRRSCYVKASATGHDNAPGCFPSSQYFHIFGLLSSIRFWTSSTIEGEWGCNIFVPVLGGNGTKIAPTGDIFDLPPGQM